MQIIGHDVSRKTTIFVEELFTNVLVEHILAIIELCDERVDLADLLSQLCRLDRPPLAFQVLNQRVQALGVRLILLKFLINGLDGLSDLGQASFSIRCIASREDTEHKHFDVWFLAAQFLDDSLYASRNLLGTMTTCIIGAD